MKDVTEIFLVNPEGLLEINKIETRTIPEFKAILIRDKGNKLVGDYDGRKKFFAFKEFMFIYTYYHPFSIYRDLEDKTKLKRCIKHSELPDKWKIDDTIKDAGKAFLKLINMSALFHSYINANRAIYALGQDINFFNTLRDKIRNKIKIKIKELEATTIEEDIQGLEAEIDSASVRLMDIGNKISNISNNLPTAFDTVENLKQKLLKESTAKSRIHGGGELNNREQ